MYIVIFNNLNLSDILIKHVQLIWTRIIAGKTYQLN